MLWHRYSPWALTALLSLVLVVLTPTLTQTSGASDVAESVHLSEDAALASQTPLKSDSYTDVVQWDNYTILLDGQRMFLHAGEFHTFRLPVPDLWLDIFQKMVAAGLNGARYVHGARTLTNPAPGVLDFEYWRALQPIYDAAKQAGIFIVLRPGPYINAETTAGGIALWATSLVAGELRTNASDYRAAWTPYVEEITSSVVPNQVSNGGPILCQHTSNNEYYQDAITGEYFVELEEAYRQAGVVIPLTYNDPGEGKNFVNGTGAVNIYGLDSYPQGFDCSDPEVWSPVVTNYHYYHETTNPGEPWYMPEFQGGSFDPWGGTGYNNCEILTGPDFQDVFYKHNWASNVKLISYYMLYGGTNWGGLAEPGVYTSYDYGSSIRENRALSDKYDELKRQGIFLRSSPEFYKTDWVGDTSSTMPGVTVNGSEVYVTWLRNPDSGAGFYIVRQANSSSLANVTFTLSVPTSAGTLLIPQISGAIAINGRESKIILTDYSFGAQSSVLYSTASVFFAGTIGSRDVLFLYNDIDESSEVALSLTGTGARAQSSSVTYTNTTSANGQVSTFTLLPGIEGLVTLWESDTQLILYSDPGTAATFWAPIIPSTTATEFANYWQFGSNTTVLVGGPYLVRNATISGSTLALRGDLNRSATLTVIAPHDVTSVTWNGEPVEAITASGGVLHGSLQMSVTASSITVPALMGWRYADSLPEVLSNFSDAEWTLADHNTTNISPGMLYGDGRVLFGCDYGFCENIVLWRGHFVGTGSETSVNLTINGGTAFAGSVWINDYFIESTWSVYDEQTTTVYTFPEGSVRVGEDNVITVIQDGMGNDESPNEKSPRGIPGFQLNSGNFTEWRVQGKLGGYTAYPDRVRGVLNEGGLYGEREGWQLPGFDTSNWEERDLSEGLPSGGAGVGFFVTTFNLSIPQETDVLMSFQFDTTNQTYRALLFVNGWNYGKRVANIGPQTRFPVPQGILNYQGTNTVAVALWALEHEVVSPSLELVVDTVIEGGVGPIAVNNPVWTPRAES
ncbi:glycoside hydrolase family 35 protein [Wolfiporia cocos MD-104 SS10]|uniref:beta-galactosidase n=1 Tax=Wolfiporia cocos (strain MD-104) TaxID=742152 RepID=A0A2H3JP49_WOLCO|nr:glycoside hydrolase family 35 protein [Wolfiporia cocos MD-104 SS10]